MSHWYQFTTSRGPALVSRFRLDQVSIRRLSRCEICRHCAYDVARDALVCSGPQIQGEACVPVHPDRGCSDWEHGAYRGGEGWYLIETGGRESPVSPEQVRPVLGGVCLARGLDDPSEEEWEWLEA